MPLVIRAAFVCKVDDDTNHMRFFRKLIRFIRNGHHRNRRCCLLPLSAHTRQRDCEERQERLWRVNKLIEHAQNHRKLVPMPRDCSQSTVRDWVEKANLPPMSPAPPTASVRRHGPRNSSAPKPRSCASQLISAIGVLRHLAALLVSNFIRWLTEDEEVCRKGRNHLAELRREFRKRPFNAILWSISWLTLLFFPICCVVCFLGFFALVPVNVVYPVTHVYPTCQRFAAGEVTDMLPCILCSSHLAAITFVLLLAPLVARRQLDWMGLRNAHNLRQAFYSEMLITEISRRHLLENMLQQRLGRNLTHYTFSFLQMTGEAKPTPRILGKPHAQATKAWE